jgi:hypothetical protein
VLLVVLLLQPCPGRPQDGGCRLCHRGPRPDSATFRKRLMRFQKRAEESLLTDALTM